jgi:hypothetical protein
MYHITGPSSFVIIFSEYESENLLTRDFSSSGPAEAKRWDKPSSRSY